MLCGIVWIYRFVKGFTGLCMKGPNPARKYDRFTDYYNSIAAIEPEGTLRALAPGDAVAVARAASGTREYFPVKVEGEG